MKLKEEYNINLTHLYNCTYKNNAKRTTVRCVYRSIVVWQYKGQIRNSVKIPYDVPSDILSSRYKHNDRSLLKMILITKKLYSIHSIKCV